MKKTLLKTSLLLAHLIGYLGAKANPGDTTWVQANIVNLDYYNNFDAKVKFPDGSKTYRQVLQIFTLGTYSCPPGTQYCHQWDYTVTNYVMTPKGDTAEISRFITPYANTGVPRFPATWKQQYIFDVTDYYPILRDSATIRLNYSGYSGGFTANVRFAFIEGVPPRNVLGVQRLWSNYYTYGNPADPIANHLKQYSLNVPSNTVSSELKFTITGHGADAADNCCEFSNNNKWHTYSVLLNNSTINTKLIYRDDCGMNELYPQGGTWIYNRANWCPGSSVQINSHTLPAAQTGSNLGLKFSNYNGSGNLGGYQVNGEVIYYDKFNHTVDASLIEIVAPTNDANYFRENPAGSAPMVRVRNTGSAAITAITFKYYVKDSVAKNYTWNGTLASLKDTLITLPTLSALTNLSLNAQGGVYQFVAEVVNVNGSADQDGTNNKLQSSFIVAPNWPNKIVVAMKTNNQGEITLNSNPSETSWQITDMNNNVIASRTKAKVKTQYNDTVYFVNPGFYKLTITDLGCDGLHWWVYDQNQQLGVTAGSFFIKKGVGTGNIAMNGYNYGGQFNNDFGCGFTQYFTTAGGAVAGIKEITAGAFNVDVYPNPSHGIFNMDITTLNENETAQIQTAIYDYTGKLVYNKVLEGGALKTTLDLSALSKGIYLMRTTINGHVTIKKLMID